MDGSEIEIEMVAGGLAPPGDGGAWIKPESAIGNKPVMTCSRGLEDKEFQKPTQNTEIGHSVSSKSGYQFV